jgi:antitoxin component YwqK of YwqJK toxin-antitoxin module/dsDNA-binding SOS-regulon protein
MNTAASFGMSCKNDSDCGAGKFCWSIMGGGKECQVKTSDTKSSPSPSPSRPFPNLSCTADFECSKDQRCVSVLDSKWKECQTRSPLNQADEQITKNTDQKEITTNVTWEKDGIVYLPNDTKPFTGKKEFFHSDGQKFSEVHYLNGKRVSTKNNEPKDEDYKTSIMIENRNGITYLPNEKKPYSGKLEHYYLNGNKKSDIHYKDGKWSSITNYFENGKKSSETIFKNDLLDNFHTSWYENGQKKFEDNHRNGKQDGIMKMWYENGRKKSESHYTEGKENGITTWWYENGQNEGEARYANGELNGIAITWDKDGQKQKEKIFKNGEQIESSSVKAENPDHKYSILLEGTCTTAIANSVNLTKSCKGIARSSTYNTGRTSFGFYTEDNLVSFVGDKDEKLSEVEYTLEIFKVVLSPNDGGADSIKEFLANGNCRVNGNIAQKSTVSCIATTNNNQKFKFTFKSNKMDYYDEFNDVVDKLSTNSRKSTVDNKNSTCESYSNLAKSVMTARQSGVAMSEVMNTISSEITKQLAIAAYEKPRFSSKEYQKKSIEDFRDKVYLDCVKAAR